MELWKNDLEKPSVYDLISKMRKTHENDNNKSNKFNHMLNSIMPSDLNNSINIGKF